MSLLVMTSYLLALGSTILMFGKLADHTGPEAAHLHCRLCTVYHCIAPLRNNHNRHRNLHRITGVSGSSRRNDGRNSHHVHNPAPLQTDSANWHGSDCNRWAVAALALGHGIGGILTQFISWHWIFFINIPIDIAGVLVALFIIPKPDQADFPTLKKNSLTPLEPSISRLRW